MPKKAHQQVKKQNPCYNSKCNQNYNSKPRKAELTLTPLSQLLFFSIYTSAINIQSDSKTKSKHNNFTQIADDSTQSNAEIPTDTVLNC